MKTKANSDNTTGSFVVAPEFSLLADPKRMDECTTEAFTFADAKGRRILFCMRRFLDGLFPDSITEACNYNDYLRALKLMENALQTMNTPEEASVLFPGVISPFPSREYIEQISSVGSHITLNLSNDNTTDLLQFMYESRSYAGKSIKIITDRTVPEDPMRTICDLWSIGADLTLCYGRAAANTLRKAGVAADRFDISDGVLTIPGKTLVKCILFDTPIDENITYSEIKDQLQTLIENEIAARFSISSKGKLYYSSDSKYDCFDPIGLFYGNCISKKSEKIRNIFSGGAECDVIAFVLRDCSDTMLRYVSAACISFNGEYPIKAVPVFRDLRYAESTEDLRSIIPAHALMCRNAYGGSILELTVSDGFDLTYYKETANMISALFGTGGLMIRIRKAAN